MGPRGQAKDIRLWPEYWYELAVALATFGGVAVTFLAAKLYI
jgi:hypothetical protein